ncbi:hypothetical protein LMG24238_00091 [Paraburkholderia sediminicola]|uniref:Uncharacterized protein n=1 Tax=Paraburkholderia sediminicola TaxID=458836 RepID=A0A6J4ZUM2_9BURK|nr:hypothetical protein LMG24238_00091 [Paraburkholderia sediminicola]CAB3803867.1 hypothetical protein LMG28690_05894 [Paraburkholderia caffeinilytica]
MQGTTERFYRFWIVVEIDFRCKARALHGKSKFQHAVVITP